MSTKLLIRLADRFEQKISRGQAEQTQQAPQEDLKNQKITKLLAILQQKMNEAQNHHNVWGHTVWESWSKIATDFANDFWRGLNKEDQALLSSPIYSLDPVYVTQKRRPKPPYYAQKLFYPYSILFGNNGVSKIDVAHSPSKKIDI